MGFKPFPHTLLFVILLGLLLRFTFIFFSAFSTPNGDVLRHIDWGKIAYLKSFAATYDKTNITFGEDPNNLPPGALYIVSASYISSLQINKVFIRGGVSQGSSFLTETVPSIFMKLPAVLADVGICLLIYKLLGKTKSTKTILGSSFYFLNPVTIYNSSIWGQIDSIPLFFFMFSLLFFFSGRYFLTMFFLLLSLFVKLTLLPLIPFYILVLLKKISLRKFILLSFVGGICILVLTLPVSLQPLSWLYTLIKTSSGGELKEISVHAFNFWWMIFGLANNSMPSSDGVFAGIPLSLWGYLIFLLSSIPLMRKLITGKDILHQNTLFISFGFIWIMLYLFFPRIHERYLFSFFGFAALYVGSSQKSLKSFIILSFLHFLNLYFVWHPGSLAIGILDMINTRFVFWTGSLLTVSISLYLYIKTLTSGYLRGK